MRKISFTVTLPEWVGSFKAAYAKYREKKIILRQDLPVTNMRSLTARMTTQDVL